MKRLNRFLTFSFILAVLASCVKEEVVLEDVQYELTAKMEMDASTRTSLSGLQGDIYYPLWSAGDELAVFVDGDASPSKFTLKSGEGATKATFAGTREGSYYYALYPFSDTTRMENGAIAAEADHQLRIMDFTVQTVETNVLRQFKTPVHLKRQADLRINTRFGKNTVCLPNGLKILIPIGIRC